MNQKYKIEIAFVILHYLVAEETQKCVQSIKENIDSKNYRIIIVDNNSENGSYELLERLYQEDQTIELLHNEKNEGFARGNNKGIKFVNSKYDSEYICCINNDVYLLDKNFVSKLQKEFKKSKFAVAGPLILSGDGRYDSNPQTIGLLENKADVLKSINRCKRMVFINKYNLNWIYLKVKQFKNRNKRGSDTAKYLPERLENVQLSGACLVFSKIYFEHFDGFCDKTFLYKEEDILRYLLKQESLRSVFLPNILVYHKEDAATDVNLRTNKEKNIFVYSEYIKSLLVLLHLMEESNKGEDVK